MPRIARRSSRRSRAGAIQPSVSHSCMHDGAAWRLPAYGSRSFDLLPATVERLLTATAGGLEIDVALLDDRYDHVVLVYFDAFGWQFVERHADHPLLRDAGAVE